MMKRMSKSLPKNMYKSVDFDDVEEGKKIGVKRKRYIPTKHNGTNRIIHNFF